MQPRLHRQNVKKCKIIVSIYSWFMNVEKWKVDFWAFWGTHISAIRFSKFPKFDTARDLAVRTPQLKNLVFSCSHGRERGSTKSRFSAFKVLTQSKMAILKPWFWRLKKWPKSILMANIEISAYFGLEPPFSSHFWTSIKKSVCWHTKNRSSQSHLTMIWPTLL